MAKKVFKRAKTDRNWQIFCEYFANPELDQRELAYKYNVTQTTIWRIITRILSKKRIKRGGTVIKKYSYEAKIGRYSVVLETATDNLWEIWLYDENDQIEGSIAASLKDLSALTKTIQELITTARKESNATQ